MENASSQALLATRALKETLRDGSLTTKVCRLDLAEAQLVTVPGELLPEGRWNGRCACSAAPLPPRPGQRRAGLHPRPK
jgi:hypothetical protein